MRVTVSTPIPKTDETEIPAEQGTDRTYPEGPRVEGMRRRFWGDSLRHIRRLRTFPLERSRWRRHAGQRTRHRRPFKGAAQFIRRQVGISCFG